MLDYHLTNNFTREEMACKCGCEKCTMKFRFMLKLQKLRSKLSRPVKVVSGFRCPAWNLAKGGAEKSPHMEGIAADIKVLDSKDRMRVIRWALHLGFKGIGINRTTIHLDDREGDEVFFHYYKKV